MTANDAPFLALESLLASGTLVLEGQLPWSSNYTFLLRVCGPDQEEEAVYKPRRGERPLWDFPAGTLCQRERAAYVVSEALGWHLVPPTVLRKGPHGFGSVQWFVPHDPEQHYFTFEGQFPEQLQRVVLFDVIINNADRKSGHILLDERDRVWLIDHGICFHRDYKLRTVVWEYAGQPAPASILQDVARFQQRLADDADPVTQELGTLLSPGEMMAMAERVRQLLDAGIFPHPGPGRHYPWPLV